MSRLGNTLEHYLYNMLEMLDAENVNKIGIQLIKIIKDVHSVGFVYNDLKPDNICTGKDDDSNSRKLQLIDLVCALVS